MKETLLRILKSFGLDKELELYLRLFKRTPRQRFAVIKISGSTLEDNLDVLAKDVGFLTKLGLYPIVVHGCSRQVARALRAAGQNGGRGDRAERLVARTLNRLTDRFVNAVNREGGSAINANDCCLVSAAPPARAGDVGRIAGINTQRLERVCRSGHVPVIGSLGWNGERAVYVDSDALASEIVRRAKPRKFILMTKMGGVFDRENRIMSTLDLQTDMPELARTSAVDAGMLAKLSELRTLLKDMPGTVVEICSPENLLRELFTVAGSGTLLRYGGNFAFKRSFRDVGVKRARRLLEDSFGKALSPDYFRGMVDLVILEKEYSCIAIVKRVRRVPYLDKFAVSQSAQGNGLGKALWHLLRGRYPSLIWRSSIRNPVNEWYFKNCDGAQKRGDWIVFWYGLDARTANRLVPVIASLPRTMAAS